MGIKDRALAFGKKFKLDSHHAIERFGVLVGIFAITGVIVLVGSGASAIKAGSDAMSTTALYTQTFTTSKTELDGDVDGVFVNKHGDKALVMMHFADRARISYNAGDYQAFLLGSDRNLNSKPAETEGIKAAFYVFGSTGYVAVLLDAGEPFRKQVLNLTIRANAELSYGERAQAQSAAADQQAGDSTFRKYDQWRVFFNPGATGTSPIPALDAVTFNPAQAYYDIVLKADEQETRDKLDQKLVAMRGDLAQIAAYTRDLQTTKVDGLFLRPPAVPESIAKDAVTGVSAAENKDGAPTLALATRYTVPGGFDLNWRSGTVFSGYLDGLVAPGQSYVEYLVKKRDEGKDSTTQQISDMRWTLSDGTSLKNGYQSSDVTMRPLMTVMNNLSQAYQNYAKNKAQYQSEFMFDLLRLEVELRDVQANASVRDDSDFLKTLY